MHSRTHRDSAVSGHHDKAPDVSCTSGSFHAEGLRLHYLDYGTAGRRPLVCLHGGGAHARWFDFVAPDFSRDCHVLSLDQRGHGDSAWTDPDQYGYEHFVSDVAAFVEHLDLRDFVLVGHSMGGNVGLLYAAQHPGRVGALVVVDSTMNMSSDRVAAMREVGSRQGRRHATREDFIRHFKLRPAGTTAPDAVIRHIAYHACCEAAEGGWRHKFDRNVFATRIAANTLPCWSSVRIPSLLVGADRSHRITVHVYEDVRARAPQVEFAQVSNSDHHVTLDNPGEFVRVVNAFLAAHP